MGNKRKIKVFRRLLPGVAMICLALLLAPPTAGAAEAPAQTELVEGFVYFRDGNHLKAVSKFFPAGLEAHELGMALLEALMAGPPDPRLNALFPETTRINALFITPEGEAYVDLESDPLPEADTLSEYLAVYGLVNSLTLNIQGITRVKILVNGTENSSLGGHLSLAPFFKTQMMIVK